MVVGKGSLLPSQSGEVLSAALSKFTDIDQNWESRLQDDGRQPNLIGGVA